MGWKIYSHPIYKTNFGFAIITYRILMRKMLRLIPYFVLFSAFELWPSHLDVRQKLMKRIFKKKYSTLHNIREYSSLSFSWVTIDANSLSIFLNDSNNALGLLSFAIEIVYHLKQSQWCAIFNEPPLLTPFSISIMPPFTKLYYKT